MAAQVAFLAITVAILSITTHATTTQQLYDPIQFSYSGATGPDKWASLNPKFSACSSGKSQSPINIVKTKCVLNYKLEPLDREYCPANATLVNNGFNIGMRYEGNAGALNLNGKNYSLIQMHWHSPSEHRLNGVQYAAELHLVHKADDGSISVVAVLYHYGRADPIVTKIQNKLGVLAKEVHSSHELGQIALGTVYSREVRKNTRKYYRYMGSFTTPPCSENVIWHILGKVRSISRAQVEALRSPLVWGCKNNSRPTQPLNGREIEMYIN